jgi:hypothetical protein
VVLLVGLLALVSGGAGLLDHLGRARIPSPERCAAQWNAPSNRRNRAIESAAHFDAAVVYGWAAKEIFLGCSVLLRSECGKPWLLFGGQVSERRGDPWAVVSGERWGFDSPEGGPETPNASVTDDGHVRLDER